MLKGFTEIMGDISPSARGASRAAAIIAALAPPSPEAIGAAGEGPGGKKALPAGATAGAAAGVGSGGVMSAVKAWAPGVAGSFVGYKMWKRHPMLGGLAGYAVADTAMGLYRGEDKKKIACDLAVETAGIMGSMKYRRHPVAGWIGGVAAGLIATSLVDGSRAHDAWQKFKAGR